jgi:ethanolamine utilization protein EutA
VCASAGHNLEATLAAHGSGAVAFSRGVRGDILHVDIGGGTSKLALVRAGDIVATAALRVGGRLVVLGDGDVVERYEDAAALVAESAGVRLAVGERLPAAARRSLAERFAAVLTAVAAGADDPLVDDLMVTDPLPERGRPAAVTLSGGVAEYVFGSAIERYGDLGPDLAAAVRAGLGAVLPLRAEPVGEVIRATVIGASQFTVQLSGSTVHVSDGAALPLRNVPVVRAAIGRDPTADRVAAAISDGLRRLDLADGDQPIALALPRLAEPRYAALRALADGIATALPDSAAGQAPLVLALDGDVGLSLGRVLIDEVGVGCPVIALDELELRELDFVDVGDVVQPAGVVPVVVKSLLFDQPPRAEQARVA